MRWIVISLVLINALIFGWRWFGPEPETPAPVVSAAKPEIAHAIELLDDEEVAPVTEAAVLPSMPADTAAATANEPASVDSEATAVSSAGVAVTDAAASPAAASTSAVVGSATPGPAEPPAGGKAEPPAAKTAISSKPAEPAAHCAWTDWLAKLPALEPGTEVLSEQQREQEIGRSYLVYIPGKASREETLARLADVKALGVEAAFLNKGPQAGGISLGLFSKPESLQVRLDQLKAAGVTDARGLERIRTEPQQRRLLRWTGEKTPTSVQNQALISCNEIAPAATGQ